MLQWLVQLGSLHLSSVQLSGQQNENENEDENEDQEQDHDQSGIIEKRDRLTSRVTSSTWSSKKKCGIKWLVNTSIAQNAGDG